MGHTDPLVTSWNPSSCKAAQAAGGAAAAPPAFHKASLVASAADVWQAEHDTSQRKNGKKKHGSLVQKMHETFTNMTFRVPIRHCCGLAPPVVGLGMTIHRGAPEIPPLDGPRTSSGGLQVRSRWMTSEVTIVDGNKLTVFKGLWLRIPNLVGGFKPMKNMNESIKHLLILVKIRNV